RGAGNVVDGGHPHGRDCRLSLRRGGLGHNGEDYPCPRDRGWIGIGIFGKHRDRGLAQDSPPRTARAEAARESTPSLEKIAPTWRRPVRGLMNNAAAIPLSARPASVVNAVASPMASASGSAAPAAQAAANAASPKTAPTAATAAS